MPFHVPSIPFIGPICAYIKDFCTYKKHHNVFIEFTVMTKQYNVQNEYEFNMCIENKTDSYVCVDKVIADIGKLKSTYAHNRLKNQAENIVGVDGCYLSPNAKSSSGKITFSLTFTGQEKPKITLEYKITDTGSKNNNRISERILPIPYLN